MNDTLKTQQETVVADAEQQDGKRTLLQNIERSETQRRLRQKRLEWGCEEELVDATGCTEPIAVAYAAAKVIEKHCANSVLSHAALSEFHHAVQLRSQKEYEAIQDSVAFTKYLLSERGGKEALGAVFAELCGEKNSLTLQGSLRAKRLIFRLVDLDTAFFGNIVNRFKV